MREIDCILVHCDDNSNPKWGLKELEILHKGKGYLEIGYHFWIDFDGEIHKTRPVWMKGAHEETKNATSIGICLHGRHVFTAAQMASLEELLIDLCKKYDIPAKHIFPHNQFDTDRTCPNFDICPTRLSVAVQLKGV